MGLGEVIGAVILGGALGAVALLGIIFLVKITYDAIKNYLNKAKKIPDAATCEVLRKKIEDGKYRVVANVFDSSSRQLETQTWEGKEIDEELRAEFGRKNKIVYDLRA